jgi:hypothetical protein
MLLISFGARHQSLDVRRASLLAGLGTDVLSRHLSYRES